MPNLNNTLLFKDCVNYLDAGARVSEFGNASNIIRAAADNDYSTFSTETDYAINIAANGNPTRVDAIFVKSKGVASHIGTPSGGTGTGWTHRTLPSTVDNIRGEAISTTVDGFQHDLYLLPAHFTATSVRLQFTGTNVEIYEMMLLEVIQEIDATTSDFVEFQAEQADRAGRVERSPIGSLSVISGEGDREKRDVNMTLYIHPGGNTLIDSPDEFLYLLEANTRLVMAEAFTENPQWVYPAIVGSLEIPVPYHNPTYKPLGYNMPILVRER